MLGTLVPLRKRRRPVECVTHTSQQVLFGEVIIYLVERKMGSTRRRFLTGLAHSKGFSVHGQLSNDVTHVVAEGNSAQELWTWLKGHGLTHLSNMQVLDISWFTESMRAGHPVAVERRHQIQEEALQPMTSCCLVSQYACQRRTTTNNPNQPLTEAFEILADQSEYEEHEGRCLAFMRAASVLKSLPHRVRCLGDLDGVPCLGEHSRAVIEEILECGTSSKVSQVLSDERYRALKLFTSVFGVGPKTAERWYRKGFRSFEDVHADNSVHLNKMQKAGFLYHNHISKGMQKAEAEAVGHVLRQTVCHIVPDAVVALTGGFRRGKESGHDVDFVVTTPEVGEEEGLLLRVINKFQHKGILLYHDLQESTLDIRRLPCRRFEAMDHYQKCFLILKLRGVYADGDWRAVRVDLVAPPITHFAFALLGWTGSRQFERDLRRYAQHERKMLLDNHALYDKTKRIFLQADTEEEIFSHLGLEFVEPCERNA